MASASLVVLILARVASNLEIREFKIGCELKADSWKRYLIIDTLESSCFARYSNAFSLAWTSAETFCSL
jgi:hypothetical protein